MKYALFLGCTVPTRAMNYEISARKVADKLDIELVDIPGFSCCGFPVASVNQKSALTMSARNIALAEKEGLDIVTLCNACTLTLTEAKHNLMHDDELRSEINERLAKFGLEFKGTSRIIHFARMLWQDYGVDKVKEKVVKPLKGIRIAPHYGCHYLKPSKVYDHFDDPENPRSLDDLINLTGAESLNYRDKLLCCGGSLLGIDEKISNAMTKTKLDAIKDVRADGIISICPFCSVMYEGNQKKIERDYELEEKYGLPVLYYPQILGLALGFSPDEMGFKLNRIKAKNLLAKLEPEEAKV